MKGSVWPHLSGSGVPLHNPVVVVVDVAVVVVDVVDVVMVVVELVVVVIVVVVLDVVIHASHNAGQYCRIWFPAKLSRLQEADVYGSSCPHSSGSP